MSYNENNPNQLPEGFFVAHLSFYNSFANYLNSYERAVEIIFEKVASRTETPDVVVMPLFFLMRHSLELGYKDTISELHYLNEMHYDSEKFKTHSLKFLHAELKEQFNKVAEKWSLSDEMLQDFTEHFVRTQVGMEQFDNLDGTSFRFRYPIDKRGNPVFSGEETLNLLQLKQLYDDSMVLLRHTADVLGPAYEMLDEYRKNMNDF
jgi:hypothetical protein